MVKNRGKTGLQNLGNTCYFNSALQALFFCEGLRSQLINQKWNRKCEVTNALSTAFQKLVKHESRPVTPKKLYNVARPEWFPKYTQQDSGEVLRYILEKITEEHGDCGTTNEASLAEKNFGGEIIQCYKCLHCNNVLKIPEQFYDLPLNLPKSAQPLHVKYLLELFSQTEKLDGKMYCDVCGNTEEAVKYTNITKYPEYLVLSINRFSSNQRKNFTVVNYPKLLPLPVGSSNIQSTTYVLISVIVHSGHTPTSGHYYCYARDSDNVSSAEPDDCLSNSWYCLNDSYVSEASYDQFAEGLKEYNSGGLPTSQVIIYRKLPNVQKQEETSNVPKLRKGIEYNSLANKQLDDSTNRPLRFRSASFIAGNNNTLRTVKVDQQRCTESGNETNVNDREKNKRNLHVSTLNMNISEPTSQGSNKQQSYYYNNSQAGRNYSDHGQQSQYRPVNHPEVQSHPQTRSTSAKPYSRTRNLNSGSTNNSNTQYGRYTQLSENHNFDSVNQQQNQYVTKFETTIGSSQTNTKPTVKAAHKTTVYLHISDATAPHKKTETQSGNHIQENMHHPKVPRQLPRPPNEPSNHKRSAQNQVILQRRHENTRFSTTPNHQYYIDEQITKLSSGQGTPRYDNNMQHNLHQSEVPRKLPRLPYEPSIQRQPAQSQVISQGKKKPKKRIRFNLFKMCTSSKTSP